MKRLYDVSILFSFIIIQATKVYKNIIPLLIKQIKFNNVTKEISVSCWC